MPVSRGAAIVAGIATLAHELDIRITSAAQSATEARRHIAALCTDHGVGSDRAADIALAVTEAVTNAIRHAYPGGCGEIDLYAEIRETALTVVVRDYGVGRSRASHDPGMGVGTDIMYAIADSCEITDAGPGTLVQLAFSLSH